MSRFAAGQWTTDRTADGLVVDDVRAVAVGDDGAVWAATADGPTAGEVTAPNQRQ